jgi:hypothetical protein
MIPNEKFTIPVVLGVEKSDPWRAEIDGAWDLIQNIILSSAKDPGCWMVIIQNIWGFSQKPSLSSKVTGEKG